MTKPQGAICTGAFGIPKNLTCIRYGGSKTYPKECGEDSYCISDTEERLVLGIADGVSGSKEDGGDPAAFARTLMLNAWKIVEKRSKKKLKPHKVIKQAFKRLVDDMANKLPKGGASTACLLSINKKTWQLKYASLGDSGFLILSPNDSGNYKIRFRSEYQLYEFNFPKQLAAYSDQTGDFDILKCIGKNTQKLQLKESEVVLLMTDGVFDNIFDHELENATDKIMKSSKSAQQLAENICRMARSRSYEEYAECPFTVEGRKHGQYFHGGKPDDITVTVAIVN